ncbi:MAG: SPOR domain-containing protein [Deltaproteobacteria bacterium]|nr:SPOR domain-containing protein [Deltaproteobacteria bacterium]
MSKKKKKNSAQPAQKVWKMPMMVVFLVLVMVLSYQLGVQRGQSMAMQGYQALQLANKEAKVEKLTFFDTLHAPIENKGLSVQKKNTASVVHVLPKIDDVPVAVEKQKTIPLSESNTPPPAQATVAAVEEKVAAPNKKDTQISKKNDENDPQSHLSIQERKEMPWAVQVGAFQDGMKAVLLRKELEKKGFGAYTLTVRHENLEIYRVLVAATTQEGSEKINAELQKDGYSTSFVMKR